MMRPLLATLVVLAACSAPPDAGSSTAVPTSVPSEIEVTSNAAGGCAHVTAVEITETGPDEYRFDVTVRSDDRGWDKYADLWTVATVDGTVLGERVLTHPHDNEQPFTRSLSGVTVSVDEVIVAARDSVLGFCGDTVTMELP